MTVSPAGHPLLMLLDCPACQANRGLVPQVQAGRTFLACPLCQFWYPILDEVAVLLSPDRNPGGVRGPLGAEVPLALERRPTTFVDLKLLAYGFFMRLHEFGSAFAVDREPVVVDVGCSTGWLVAWLHPRQTYVGFDLSFDSLRFARRGTGHFFVQADATRLPIKTGAVPFFAAREVLEHLTDPLAGLRELARIGRRGVVVVPTLDFPFLYDPLNWLLVRRGRHMPFGVYGYGHQQVHDTGAWRQLVRRGGFEVRRESPIGTGPFLNASDLLWHTLYSWRDFDRLPRHGLPMPLARALLRLGRAVHRLDGPLLASHASSRAFEVTTAGSDDRLC